MNAPVTPPGGFGAVGKQLSRVDGPLKVTGAARFAAEIPLDGLVCAALAYSSIARGRIVSIDVAAAEAAPGVVHVMTDLNAPRLEAPPLMNVDPEGASTSVLAPMQDDAVRWNGQPVAVVVAECLEQAEHAATLIRVDYAPETAAVAFDGEKARARTPEQVMGEKPTFEKGDAEAALASAEVSVDLTFRTPRHNNSSIEPHAVTVAWNSERLIVHDASQMVGLTRSTFARVFRLSVEDVEVTSPFVGGGFGNKSFWDHHILAAAVSRQIGRPVRLALTREGVFRAVGGRTLTEQRVAIGANKDGRLTALIHSGIAGMTSHNDCPEQFTFPARHLYEAETFALSQQIVELNMVANTFMRAPGEAVGTFALECAIDELAEKLDLDPVELRRRVEPDKDPTSELEFSARNLLEAYARGAERFGWDRRNPKPRMERDGEWLVGRGVATATYPYYRMPGGAARIRLTAEGAVVEMAAHEMGMGTATAQAQLAADRLGLPVEQVAFHYGDASLPTGTMAGGSSQSASIAAAMKAASDVLTVELLRLAGNDSPLAGLAPGDVETRDGGLFSRSDPKRGEAYGSILSRSGRAEAVGEAPAPEPAEMSKYSMHSYGAQFCEARVSEITGEVRISRWVGSFDTGKILNPKTAASQFRGGIIMGIGLALMEEVMFDERTGRIMNPSLAEYHVPVHLDVPEIEVIWTDIPDPQAPFGLRGIGEIGITGGGAAVANAVYNATGVRVRDLPITLDKLM